MTIIPKEFNDYIISSDEYYDRLHKHKEAMEIAEINAIMKQILKLK
jgi:hypothetical protein